MLQSREEESGVAGHAAQESAVLAVLDRTMFRFHRSTTWLDQAQRKAPRRLVRVKGQEAASERGQERSEEAAWSGRPEQAPPRVISTGAGFHRSTSRDRARCPPRPGHRQTGGREENRREATGAPLTLEFPGRTQPSQGN